jgi:hypothetical protein
MRMHGDLQRGRAEQQTGEVAATSRAEHHEIRQRGLPEQHHRWGPGLEHGSDLDVAGQFPCLPHGGVEDLLRDVALGSDEGRFLQREELGAYQIEGVDDPEWRGAAARFVGGPAKGREAVVGSVDPGDYRARGTGCGT